MDHDPIPSVEVSDVPDPLPDGLQVLDVREDLEWAHGHIDDALHIPLMDLPVRLHEVEEQQVLVVCRVGARSAHAVGFLRAHGRDAVNLSGGMVAWAQAGRPMAGPAGAVPQVV